MTDFCTVISPHDDAVLTKKATMVDGNIKLFAAAQHRFFKSHEVKVDSIKSLSNLLLEIETVPHNAVIRGRLVDGVDKNHHKRRKLREGGGKKDDQSYTEADHAWVMIDIDGLSSDNLVFHDPINHPLDTMLSIVDMLPTVFRHANFHYQYSSSQGLKPKNSISCHVWFWMNKKVADKDLKRYFSLYNESGLNAEVFSSGIIDTVLYEPIQLHFTAAPVIDGFEDPIAERSGFYDGRNQEVDIANEWIFDDPKKKGNYLKFLERVGDDKDGFHWPLMQAGGSYINEFGKPSASQRQLYVETSREYVLDSKISESRPDGIIAKYSSDHFLSRQLDTALEKGFAQGIPDGAVQEIMEHMTYVSSGDNFYFPKTREYMSKDSVNAWNAHLTGGRAVVPLILASDKMRKVNNIQTIPGDTNELVQMGEKKVFNTWAGRPILINDNEKDPVPLIEAHISDLVDGDPAAYKHLTQYMAWCLRRPGKKIRHAIVLGGIQGTGKSFIKVMMHKLMGKENVFPISNNEVKEKYNGWIESAELICVEELMAQGKLEIANRLKPLITEDIITIRRMRTDPYNIVNYANIIAFTNHENAMMLDDRDRRYWVWVSGIEPKSAKYYIQLFNTVKLNPKALKEWLEGIDISDFNPSAKPPETKSKLVMAEHSKPMIEMFVESRIEEEDWPFACDLIVMNHIIDVLPSKFNKISSTKMAVELKKHGAIQLGQFRMDDGTKPKVWSIRNHEKYVDVPGKVITDGYIRPTKSGYNTMGIDY